MTLVGGESGFARTTSKICFLPSPLHVKRQNGYNVLLAVQSSRSGAPALAADAAGVTSVLVKAEIQFARGVSFRWRPHDPPNSSLVFLLSEDLIWPGG